MTVELTALTKSYDIPGGEEIAVNGIDIDIGEDEFVSLVGPSGCGKSTTLRCIAGLETPTSGEIRINGEDVTDTAPNKRGLAMMFQDIALYPHMTVRENIAYPLKVRGVSKDNRHEEATAAAEVMRIADLLDKYPGELSGGQRQRCALARTIVYDPKAFLMDEPLSDLDAKLKVAVRKEIQRVHDRVERPTIYVTHDQAEALSMSDRVAVMNDGELMGIATPDEHYNFPANKFIASFIGNPSMNFVTGQLRSSSDREAQHASSSRAKPGDGTITVEFHDNEIELGATGNEPRSETVEIGFRPEVVDLHTDPDEGYFEGTLELIERIGDRRLATIQGPDGEIRAMVPDSYAASEGAQVGVSFDERDAHVFDDRTQNVVGRGRIESAEITAESSS